MPSESIVWTALPHGFSEPGTDRKLRVSVYLAPRLTAGSGPAPLTVASFPELTHWTERVSSTQLSFELRWEADDAADLHTATLTPLAQDRDPVLWERIFQGVEVEGVQVRTRSVRNLVDVPIASFPADASLAGIRQHYQDSAVSTIFDTPRNRRLQDTLEGIRVVRDATSRSDAPLDWQAPEGGRYRIQSPQVAVDSAAGWCGQGLV